MLKSITEDNFDVELYLAYATEDNFTGKKVYDNAKCFLHEEAVQKLNLSIKYAAQLGYKIKIFDAFRPREAQYILWDSCPDPDFLAHPDRGSPHSRGVAIDLTLIDSQGQELEMGTPFDSFSPKSFHGNDQISQEAIQNRQTLLGIMTLAGWDFFKNEWWHYQLFNSKDYQLYTDKEAGTGIFE